MTTILAADGIPAWVAPLVGTPFAARGRDLSGADCWGLAGLAYSACGRSLPDVADYRDSSDVRAIQAAMAQVLPNWQRVAWGQETALDLAQCLRPQRRPGGWTFYPLHVATVVRPGIVLDTDQRSGAHLASYGETRRLGITQFWRLVP